MFYVFDLTMTVQCSGLRGEEELSGILVYWLKNPMIDADGGYTNDSFSRAGAYKTYQEFINNHIIANEEMYNLIEIK